MCDDPRANRHYNASVLPTLARRKSAPPRQDMLLALYQEICSSWRMLTNVRFKLLGFIPVISGAVLFNLLSGQADAPTPLARAGIAAFGFVVTLALWIYDTRNSELYDDLISRGRKIEEELGIDTGQFRGRPTPARAGINHSNATRLIYGSATVGWVIAVVFIGLKW